jgi:hypothetical protein
VSALTLGETFIWRIRRLDRIDDGSRRVVLHWGSESRSHLATDRRGAAGKHVAHVGRRIVTVPAFRHRTALFGRQRALQAPNVLGGADDS